MAAANADYTFMVVRHVTDAQTDEYWRICCARIRRHHPGAHIVVVDDNSSRVPSAPPEPPVGERPLVIIASEFPQRGELLGYYYFHKLRPSAYGVILHDSVFLSAPLPLGREGYRFLWDFHPESHFPVSYMTNMRRIMGRFAGEGPNDALSILGTAHWTGCFGCMAMVSHAFLARLDAKYGLFSILLAEVQTREARMWLERMLGCIFGAESPPVGPPVFGNIHMWCRIVTQGKKYFNIGYAEYSARKAYYDGLFTVMKVWTGR